MNKYVIYYSDDTYNKYYYINAKYFNVDINQATRFDTFLDAVDAIKEIKWETNFCVEMI
jgi:hypothetical protein